MKAVECKCLILRHDQVATPSFLTGVTISSACTWSPRWWLAGVEHGFQSCALGGNKLEFVNYVTQVGQVRPSNCSHSMSIHVNPFFSFSNLEFPIAVGPNFVGQMG